MGPVNWGILGCARVAEKVMAPGIRRSLNGRLYAVASRDVGKAQTFAVRFDAPKAYGSYEELLADDDIDAVYIPLPNSLHKEWTIRAARAGKNVYCEKPLACSIAEAEQMVKACKESHVLLMEGFAHRHHPQNNEVKNLIDRGRIGMILQATAFHCNSPFKAEDIKMDPSLGGGALMDIGCYCINTARYLIGAEPAAVHATQQLGASGVDERTTATLYFPGGERLFFDANLQLSSGHYTQEYTVYGEKGKIHVPKGFTQVETYRYGKLRKTEYQLYDHSVGHERRKVYHCPAVHQWQLAAEYFSGRILLQEEIEMPAENGLENTRVIEAVVESARSGQAVKIDR